MNLKSFFLIIFCFSSNLFAQEIYLAKFETLNPQVNGKLAGSTTVYITNDQLLIYVRLFAGAQNTWHQQNIYLGNRCPTMTDDTNNDGVIDILEANQVLGSIILPLDGDLNSQMSGINTYPVGNLYGSYFYEKEARYSYVLRDLKSIDQNPNDNITKLGRNQNLILKGKAVLIQGVGSHLLLPETVVTFGNRQNFQTLPIACGILD